MQWRLILEEYSPAMIYIKDSKTIVADALSRLDIVGTPNPVKNNISAVNERYGLEDEDSSHLINHKTSNQNQQKDKELIKIAKNNKDYSIQNFYGINKKYSLIYRNSKIVIPKQLEIQVVD